MELKPQRTQPKESNEQLSFRVLVADDDELNRRIFKKFLESMGHKVKIVEDGQLLLDELVNEGEGYDVVVSDNTMPKKKGTDVLKEIRLMDKFKQIPFIIATTDSTVDGSLERNIINLGGFYLPKPFSKEQLSSAIDQTTKAN